jgi:cytochrome P450
MTLPSVARGPAVIDLTDPAFWQDPYPAYDAARRRHPTAVSQAGEPILLRAADLDVVLTDPAFENMGVRSLERLGIRNGPFYEWRTRTLAAIEGAEHDRLRSVVSRWFTPARAERLRSGIRAHAAKLLTPYLDVGIIDVVRHYAWHLPLWVICEFVGVPQEDGETIEEFLVGTEAGFTDPMTDEARLEAEGGIVALYDYVERLVGQRQQVPTGDLISRLVNRADEPRLDRQELLALIVNIVGGAIGSSRAAIVNSLHLLLRYPEQGAVVRDRPDMLKRGVEECLRFAPPFRSGRRRAARDVDRFGLQLRAGDTLYLARQAANRDPERWERPDRFDVTRPERRHYSFGYGSHFCLGQALARIDAQEAVRVFLECCTGAELLVDNPARVPFVMDEQLRALPVAFHPAGPTHPRIG